MSQLTTELKTELAKPEHNAKHCTACELLALVDIEEREVIQAALSSKIGAKRLASILRRNSYPMGANTLREHRNERHGQ